MSIIAPVFARNENRNTNISGYYLGLLGTCKVGFLICWQASSAVHIDIHGLEVALVAQIWSTSTHIYCRIEAKFLH